MKAPINLPSAVIRRLKTAARKAAATAYAPYSDFKVGAAVLTQKGSIFTGCNIENSSYGLTICAERVALFKAIAAGERRIRAVAVYTTATQAAPAVPCGACLQVLNEFGNNPVIILAGRTQTQTLTLRDLLPYGFRLKEKN